MARTRSTSASTETATTDDGGNNMSSAVQSLSLDEITGLLASQRGRGEYDEVLVDFLKSGEAGIVVPREGGTLAGKTADNVVTGLRNAINRTRDGKIVHPEASECVAFKRMISGDPKSEADKADESNYAVYLIDKSKLGAEAAAAVSDEATS